MDHPLLNGLEGIKSTYESLGHKVCDLSDITEAKMDKILIETIIKGSTTVAGVSRFNETVLSMNLESSTRLCPGNVNDPATMMANIKANNITPGESNAHYWMKLHQNNATFNIDLNSGSIHIPVTYPKRKFSSMNRYRGMSESKQQDSTNNSSLTSQSSLTHTSSSTLSTMDGWNDISVHSNNSGNKELENRAMQWSIDDIKNSIEIFDTFENNTKQVDTMPSTTMNAQTSTADSASDTPTHHKETTSNDNNSQDTNKEANSEKEQEEESEAAKDIVNIFTEEVKELDEGETIVKRMRVEAPCDTHNQNGGMHHGIPQFSIDINGADSPLLSFLSDITNDSNNGLIIHDLNTENVSRLNNETPVAESKHGSISTLTGGDSGNDSGSGNGSGSEEDVAMESEPPIHAPAARRATRRVR